MLVYTPLLIALAVAQAEGGGRTDSDRSARPAAGACIADADARDGICRAPAAEELTAEVAPELNVLQLPLETCSEDPLTGFYRNGRCATGADDRGIHVVCAEMTKAFLEFSRSRGNDLITAVPRYRFPGLKPGQRWCLCAARYAEAVRANVAPPVVLEATHAVALRSVSLQTLQRNTTVAPRRASDERSRSESESPRSNP